MRYLSLILLSLVGVAPAMAAPVTVSLSIEADQNKAALSPVPAERLFPCQSPWIPAELALERDLSIYADDLSPFFQTAATTKTIKVRRGGIVHEDDAASSDQPVFSNRFFTPNAQQDAADLNLDLRLSFCVYRGFLDFVGGNYALNGTIGNYKVARHDTLAAHAATDLALSYASRNWTEEAGGQFLPLQGYGHRDDANQILGALDLRLTLGATPFTMIDAPAKAPLLVDVGLRPTLLVTTPGSTP